MTYSTSYSTRTNNRWLSATLAIAYAIVAGTVAYALPLTSLLQKVTR